MFDLSKNTCQEIETAEPRPLNRTLHTACPISENEMLIFGGMNAKGEALNDTWLLTVYNEEGNKTLSMIQTHPY